MLAGGLNAAEEKELFAGTFQNGLVRPWTTIGGTWQVQQGLLQQVEAGLDDPSKAVLIIGDPEEMSSGIVVTAKLRLDTWKGDDQARAGVGLCCDPESGHGLNLAFNRGQLQFLHDYVQWEPGCEFAYRTGVWYWMKLYKSPRYTAGKGVARRRARAGRLDGLVDGVRRIAHRLPRATRLVGRSGGRGIVGLVCRVSGDAHRPEPNGLVCKAVHLAGNDDGQCRGSHAGAGRVRILRSASGPRCARRHCGGECSATSPTGSRGGKWPGNVETASGRQTDGRAPLRNWPSAMWARRGPDWSVKRAGWPRP